MEKANKHGGERASGSCLTGIATDTWRRTFLAAVATTMTRVSAKAARNLSTKANIGGDLFDEGLGLMNTKPKLTAQAPAGHDAFSAFSVHRSISGYGLWTPRCAVSAVRRHSITQSSTKGPSRGPATDERMNHSMFSARCVPQLDRAFRQQMSAPGPGRSPCLCYQPPRSYTGTHSVAVGSDCHRGV